jgi:hypothetical protein
MLVLEIHGDDMKVLDDATEKWLTLSNKNQFTPECLKIV